jgi:hypothetical protein
MTTTNQDSGERLVVATKVQEHPKQPSLPVARPAVLRRRPKRPLWPRLGWCVACLALVAGLALVARRFPQNSSSAPQQQQQQQQLSLYKRRQSLAKVLHPWLGDDSWNTTETQNAMEWLVQQDPCQLNATSPALKQRFVLIKTYLALGIIIMEGDSKRTTTAQHDCNWTGVYCFHGTPDIQLLLIRKYAISN